MGDTAVSIVAVLGRYNYQAVFISSYFIFLLCRSGTVHDVNIFLSHETRLLNWFMLVGGEGQLIPVLDGLKTLKIKPGYVTFHRTFIFCPIVLGSIFKSNF